MTVKQAMHRGVDWCPPETPLSDVAKLMRDKDVGAIPIGENDRLIGMVTDRDIVCRAISDGRDLDSITAGDVMTCGIIYCTEDEDIEDAIYLMEMKQVRRLPVVNREKRLVGMLSLGDVSHRVSRELSGEFAGAVSAHH
ncbi:CBS domain-containing protein [Emcibacter sp. SYSU 3D8]|uniref:CBS domain-containing protein n=1 Tax=Emcibacter sp. SYSU 3D8 TaxID=3133969 RepID=UPI0031FEA334